jgi:hypothetical protein
MTSNDKLEDNILSLLFATSSGEFGSAWLRSDEVLSQVQKTRPSKSYSDILQATEALEANGLIEFVPVGHDNLPVGFVVRISRVGINMHLYGVRSLIRADS